MSNHITRKFLAGVTALSLAAFYTGCSSGGGGATFFWGILGTGANTCSSVIVRIDLAAAGATDEQLNCARAALIGAGCTVDEVEVSPGSGIWDVTISGCNFSDLSDLFTCTVNGVSASDLDEFSDIVGDNCGGGTPPLAVDDTPVVTTTTTTQAPTTTTTAPPTTTTTVFPDTTTTTVGGTTTTVLGTTTTVLATTTTLGVTTTTLAGATFDVVYGFDFPMSTVGALQIDSDYSGAGGEFDGTGANVACAKAAGFTALEAFNDNDTGQVVSQGFADSAGFAAPRVLSTCRFVDADGTPPAPSAFVNTTVDCSDLNSQPVNCFTSVQSVTACACGDSTVNCVTENCDNGASSATNTCGDGTVNCSACTDEQCDDGNATDDGNGCSADCQDNSTCGNNIVESAFEQCDDGGSCQFGSNPGAACTLPAGAECTGGFCQTQSGDGCSSTCQTEP